MIFISLGSNLGHRLAYLHQAFQILKERKILLQPKETIILETEAIVPKGAPDSWRKPYLNMVVSGVSSLAPRDFLSAIQDVEKDMGRPFPREKWSPRIIDIDILLWNDQTIHQEDLTIPHVQLNQRPFLGYLIGLPTSGISIQNSFALFPKLVGILNVTPDSFSDGGQFIDPERAVGQAKELIKQGAYILDIGAQSTRPGAQPLDFQEEYRRLKPVFEALRGEDTLLSLDSYNSKTISKILEDFPLAWINDQAGKLEEGFLRNIASLGCSIVTMHALDVPVKLGHTLDPNIDVWRLLEGWARQRLNFLARCGFTKKTIIFDPGIGFGKTPEQNLKIMSQIGRLRRLGCPLLVGHSRKSYITSFSPHVEPASRDVETLALSEHLRQKNVDYLRVHAIDMHQRFFVAQKMIGNF